MPLAIPLSKNSSGVVLVLKVSPVLGSLKTVSLAQNNVLLGRRYNWSITVANSTRGVRSWVLSLSSCISSLSLFALISSSLSLYACSMEMPVVEIHKYGVWPLAKNVCEESTTPV